MTDAPARVGLAEIFSTSERQAGLRDFWAVYEPNAATLDAARMDAMRNHVELGALARAATPEQIAAQSAAGQERFQQALSGDWGAYESNLRAQGAGFAKMGTSMRGWYEVVGSFTGLMIPLLVGAYASDPPRLTRALLALEELMGFAMRTIAETYLDTKEAAIRESEHALAATREQARRAHEASRLKGEFLANMSHELRTPLNAILGFAQLMHDGKAGPVSAPHAEYLGDILHSGRHLLALINDVLDLSKIEAGRIELAPVPVDLAGLIEEVRSILRELAARKRVYMESAVDPALDTVVIDPAKLKQVLYNYLSNAIKFTPEEGRVAIRAVPEGGDAFRLEVEDSGIGVAAADLPRLFVEFQQLDAGAAKKFQGTGLGLALTKRIVAAQGGQVGVRSRPGEGSTFWAVLPRVGRAGPALPGATEAPLLAPRAGAPTILVVEDDAHDRDWLVRTLAGAGYAVTAVGSGAEALAQAGRRAFDAVTLDILLPDMSGIDVGLRLRQAFVGRDVPLIVVTIIADKDVAATLSARDILVKPLVPELLLAALERVLVRP
jgi:signal transduction histidine kinase